MTGPTVKMTKPFQTVKPKRRKVECRQCGRKFLPPANRKTDLCPAHRPGRVKLGVPSAQARRKELADAYLQTRREPRTAVSVQPAPYPLPDLETLIADADAASDRALKAAANPAAIEPRPEPPPGLSPEDKLEIVMLYGDVPQGARNRWLLERGRRQYVDYFAPAGDADDKRTLGLMLGLYSDVPDDDD